MHKSGLKICIVSHTHLCRNPRVLKEAVALSQAGYNVQILNSIHDANLLREDQNLITGHPIVVQHISDLSIKNITSFFDRLIKKAADFSVKYLGIETKYALGYAPNRYLQKAKALNADLYICHQELPIYIGLQLGQSGYKTAFDLEDWHSEDLSPIARKSKAIGLLRKAEKFALKNAVYCSTTAHVLAKKLSEAYQSRLPAVIYNVFDLAPPTSDQRQISRLKLVWFSQYIGEGRGIEEFMDILNHIEIPLEFHLIGDIAHAFKALLIEKTPKQHLIVFHGMMQSQQLDVALRKFDIGLAIELHESKSREYTITNKFFQYIQNGLPVIATDTAGQKEIFELNKPGLLISYDAIDHKHINQFLASAPQLAEAKKMALKTAQAYHWKTESAKLIKLVENALNYEKN